MKRDSKQDSKRVLTTRNLLLGAAFLLLAGSALAQAPVPLPAPQQLEESHDVFYWAQAQPATPTAGQRVRLPRPGKPDVVGYSATRMIGPWWKNSEIANELHLTDQQKEEIDQSFYQYRLQLIDATAATQKLDTQLDQLMNAEYLEEGKINETLDQLVQARGQLSRIYAGMLISIRKVLLPEQWKSLQTIQSERGPMPMMLPMMLEPGMFGMGMPPAAGGVIFNRRVPPLPPGAPVPPNAPAPPQQQPQ